MFSDGLHRKIAELAPAEQAIVEEVVREAAQYVTQRTPLGYDIARKQYEETTKRLRTCERKLTVIRKVLRELDSSSPPELATVLERIRRLVNG
jgi:TRAP-type C4-dicarboxylate transport system substrate-binding protein